MDLKTITKKVKAEAKKLESAPAKLKKQLDGAPQRLKKQLDVEVKKLEGVSGRLKKQLEGLSTKAAEAVGIVSTGQLKSLRAELGKLTRRVDALSKGSTGNAA